MAEELQSFHFNVAGSEENKDVIGFCARVVASTKEEAIATLQEAFNKLEDEHTVFDDTVDDTDRRPTPGLQYITVYFYGHHLTEEHIDESEEFDGDLVEVGLADGEAEEWETEEGEEVP